MFLLFAVLYLLPQSILARTEDAGSSSLLSPSLTNEREPEPRLTATSEEEESRATSTATSGSITIIAPTRRPLSQTHTHSSNDSRPSHSLTVHPGAPFTHPIPHPPSPTSPDHPPDNENPPQTHRSGQPIVAIVFEALAGVVGLFILYGLSRCLWSWKHTPERDRVASLLSRHYLEREMEEREREQMEQRMLRAVPRPLPPPPPPYQHAPSYEAAVEECAV
ncbi:hypothetical protein PHLCEN_2v4663 [Hermanssonia centrifuga]|uniref:Transmembrane protein n=1 Tax=Hermanssonia centrifuga TaxID=98765 RepID=A0A2R6PMX6_9APHY|nr:hypothetical protein PHLCEN_2v4663 [Hermanssonia centrifuga]